MQLPEPVHTISNLIDQYHSEFYVYAHCKPETGVRFFGTKHAAEWLHIKNPKACSSAIARSCAKPGKIAYGYTWRYE